MKHILLFMLLCISCDVYSQEKVDTLYYSKSGKITHTSIFADYYKIVVYPTDSLHHKEFKDFYTTSELKREGYFLSIDSLNDNRSVLDGEIISYFKNGRIAEKTHYLNGKLTGEYLQYKEDGTLDTQALYSNGRLSGVCKVYNDDGSCRIVEYCAGEPAYNYYLLSDSNGNTLKYGILDDRPIWESPALNERFVDYRDGTPWEVYFKNGITVALTNSIVKDYGRWHRIDLIISNNALTPVEFSPEENIRAYSIDEQGITTNLQVWSCDAYLKKVNRAQTWAAIAVGFSEGLATSGAGYSTSTTTGYSSSGNYSTYTTTTYNSSAAFQANLASQQRLANFSQALQDEKSVKQMGYLKKNTVYPQEAISGFVHIERIKGIRVIFIIQIENAEYIYEWDFDKKNIYLPETYNSNK